MIYKNTKLKIVFSNNLYETYECYKVVIVKLNTFSLPLPKLYRKMENLINCVRKINLKCFKVLLEQRIFLYNCIFLLFNMLLT